MTCESQPNSPAVAHVAVAHVAGPAHRLPLVLAAAACLAYLTSELYLFSGGLGLPLDDSWIHLHFARQLATGAGLAYNPERWIAGSTAPLWTAILALAFTLPGGILPWVKLLGTAFFLTTVHATDRLAAELGLGHGLRLLAATLVATTHWLVWSALSGMEITLFATLSLWGIILHLRERAAPSRLPVSLPVLALATLARPEGFLLLAAALVDRLLRFEHTAAGLRLDVGLGTAQHAARRLLLDGLGTAALVLVPTLIFYRVIGGSFLPTTFAVKSAPMADLIPSSRYLRAVVDVVFRSQPVMLLVAGAGVLRLVARLGSGRDRGLLPALWPLGLALAYSLLAPEGGAVVVGNFGRYYFPLLPVVVVLGVLGLEQAVAHPALVLGDRRLPVRAVLVALVVAPQLWGLATGSTLYTRTIANVEDSDVRAARWLAGRLPPDALLAVQDVGAIKYFLPNSVVDLTGIVNPEILPYLRGTGRADPVSWEDRLLGFLEQVKPDYLVVFPSSYPRLTSRPGFRRIRAFSVGDNLAMAGNELVIFSTPWTSQPLRAQPTE
ncbi:MAG: hypothetical protein GY856_10940 [bacterium]|nr:hypothetical protein [bacterium]